MVRRTGKVREVPGPPVAGLPPYLMRHNPSARRLRITVSPRRGVVVTVPPHTTVESAVGFLTAKRSWVVRAVGRIEERNVHHAGGARQLPEEIVLPAAGERWTVTYRPTSSATVRALPRRNDLGAGERALVVSGQVTDVSACLRALNRFVDARAREVLPAELQGLAETTGLQPGSISVRHQRTRWGSCSTTGAVSLNRTLLFLPRELAVAIMLHELVHLVRHDHSDQFWAALEQVDPQARAHRKAMREAWRLVPPWAEAPHTDSSGDT